MFILNLNWDRNAKTKTLVFLVRFSIFKKEKFVGIY